MHPIAGQGLNLGFRDVAALAEEMIAAWNAGERPRRAGGAGAATRRGARPDTLLMLCGMHALERLFGNDFAPVRIARRLGIAAVDRMPGAEAGLRPAGDGHGPGVAGLLAARGCIGAPDPAGMAAIARGAAKDYQPLAGYPRARNDPGPIAERDAEVAVSIRG